MSLPRSAVLACLVAGASWAAKNGDAPRHIGLSRFDQQLACIGNVLGKPVMTGFGARTGVGQSLLALHCQVPVKPDRLREDLRSLGLSVLDAGDWYVLIESSRFEPDSPRNVLGGYRWKRLMIREKFGLARPDDDRSAARRLSVAELEVCGREMLRAMRPVSVSLTRELVQDEHYPEYAVASPDGETTIREIFLNVDVVKLGPTASERVIGLLRTDSNGFQGRMGVGEFDGDKVRLLWDSPVVSALHQRLDYDDVDGDGIREIVLLGADAVSVTPYRAYFLTIFDKDGKELTRQSDCTSAELLWDTPEGSACSLVGSLYDRAPARSGRGKDVVVWGDSLFDKEECRYELKGGHYVADANCRQR